MVSARYEGSYEGSTSFALIGSFHPRTFCAFCMLTDRGDTDDTEPLDDDGVRPADVVVVLVVEKEEPGTDPHGPPDRLACMTSLLA